MTTQIHSVSEILDRFSVAVLDQWGVLHNGTTTYAQAAHAMRLLSDAGKSIVVLSNSGKRADVNLRRIATLGLPSDLIDAVVTSGEVLREDLLSGNLRLSDEETDSAKRSQPIRVFPICGTVGDAEAWVGQASDQIEIVDRFETNLSIDAILMMGLPDGSSIQQHDDLFRSALDCRVPLLCSNPDQTSPRSGGLVVSPGALATRYQELGGHVVWYGKPHPEVFQHTIARFSQFAAKEFLMIGDSLHHDIAGAHKVGFQSMLVQNGIHTNDFAVAADKLSSGQVLDRLCVSEGIAPPNFSIPEFA